MVTKRNIMNYYFLTQTTLLSLLLPVIPMYGMNEKDLILQTTHEKHPILQEIQHKIALSENPKLELAKIQLYASQEYSENPEQLYIDITSAMRNIDYREEVSKEYWLSITDLLLNTLFILIPSQYIKQNIKFIKQQLKNGPLGRDDRKLLQQMCKMLDLPLAAYTLNILIEKDIQILNHAAGSIFIIKEKPISTINAINNLANNINQLQNKQIPFIKKLKNNVIFTKYIFDKIISFIENSEEREQFEKSWTQIKDLIQSQKNQPQQILQQPVKRQTSQQPSTLQKYQQQLQIILEKPITEYTTQSKQQRYQQSIGQPEQQQQQIKPVQTQTYQQNTQHQPQQSQIDFFTQLTSGLTNIWNAISSFFTNLFNWRPW
jgi:hypothetical protein